MAETKGDADTVSDFMGGKVVARLFQLFAERPWLLAAGIVLSIIAGLLAFAPHAAIFALYGRLAQGSFTQFSATSIAMAGFALLALRWFFTWAAMFLAHVLAFDIQKKLRLRLADRMLKAPMHQLLERSSGDVRATVITDVDSLEDGLAHLLPDIVGASVSLLTVFGIFVFIDWRLALAAIASVIVGFVCLGLLAGGQSKGINKYFALKAETDAMTTEYVKALPVLRIFNAGDGAMKRINDLIDQFKDVAMKVAVDATTSHTAFLVFLTSNVLLLAPIGYALVQSGGVTPLEFAFVLIFSIGFGDACLSFLNGLVQRFGTLSGVVGRIDDLIALKQLPEPVAPKKPTGVDITFDDVSFKYNEQPVLKDVSFTISPGERIALVGPSGSGKSTMARLIPRFMDVDKGAIKIGGVDVRQIKNDDLGDVVSFVFQEVFLFSETIRHNIEIGRPGATQEEIEDAARRAQAHSFISELPDGYNTRLREGGQGLSLGQKQRLSIARAILKNAPVLILDEATAYADPENEARVRAALSELSKDKTVLMIAHRLRSITDVDRIFVLENGHIVQTGPHQDLSTREGLYQRLWRSQQTEEAA